MPQKKIFIATEELVHRREVTYFELDTEYSQFYKPLWNDYLRHLTDGSKVFFLWLQSKMTEKAWLPSVGQLLTEYRHEEKKSKSVFYNHLNELKKKKVIIRLMRGTYRFNPVVVWKGSISERENATRHLVEADNLTPPLLAKEQKLRP